MKSVWPRFSTIFNKRNPKAGQQQASALLALPNEILAQITREVFTFIFNPSDKPGARYHDWRGFTLSCRSLYILSTEVWKHLYFNLPGTMDLAKWTWRRPTTPPRLHHHLTLFLELPSFIKLPGEIRMPPTRFIHYLKLDWEATWVMAAHGNDRFFSMPELPVLKVLVFGPIGYASPWTCSVLHLEQLASYHSKAISKGGFRRGAMLWSRFVVKCPLLQGAYTIREFEQDGGKWRPMSRRLTPEVRASSLAAVQKRIIALDNTLFDFMVDLVAKRAYWMGSWQQLVKDTIEEWEPRYDNKMLYCPWW